MCCGQLPTSNSNFRFTFKYLNVQGLWSQQEDSASYTWSCVIHFGFERFYFCWDIRRHHFCHQPLQAYLSGMRWLLTSLTAKMRELHSSSRRTPFSPQRYIRRTSSCWLLSWSLPLTGKSWLQMLLVAMELALYTWSLVMELAWIRLAMSLIPD